VSASQRLIVPLLAACHSAASMLPSGFRFSPHRVNHLLVQLLQLRSPRSTCAKPRSWCSPLPNSQRRYRLLWCETPSPPPQKPSRHIRSGLGSMCRQMVPQPHGLMRVRHRASPAIITRKPGSPPYEPYSGRVRAAPVCPVGRGRYRIRRP
jgi:hypothetical protein